MCRAREVGSENSTFSYLRCAVIPFRLYRLSNNVLFLQFDHPPGCIERLLTLLLLINLFEELEKCVIHRLNVFFLLALPVLLRTMSCEPLHAGVRIARYPLAQLL